MRSDLLERVHSLPLDNEQRLQVLNLVGCFSLATVLLRMRRMNGADRSRLEARIEEILECGPRLDGTPAGAREDASLPVGLRGWLWKMDSMAARAGTLHLPIDPHSNLW
jgi:hypothetical protein